MRRPLVIVSLLALVTALAALVAQMLTVTQGIYYDPNGQPVHPSTLTLIVTILGVAGVLSLPPPSSWAASSPRWSGATSGSWRCSSRRGWSSSASSR